MKVLGNVPLYHLPDGARILYRGAKMRVTDVIKKITEGIDTFDHVYVCQDIGYDMAKSSNDGIYLPMNLRVDVLAWDRH